MFAIVNNIPFCFRSADLRRFFSSFIESECFECFHFRHRPEHLKILQKTNAETLKNVDNILDYVNNTTNTCCCIVTLSENKYNEMHETYHGRQWSYRKNKDLSSKCFISRVKVSDEANHCSDKDGSDCSIIYSSGIGAEDGKDVISYDKKILQGDFTNLPELRPPCVMPNGNVGTPTKYFLALIQECRLPSSIIRKLELNFTRPTCKGKYGKVAFSYPLSSPRALRLDKYIKHCTEPQLEHRAEMLNNTETHGSSDSTQDNRGSPIHPHVNRGSPARAASSERLRSSVACGETDYKVKRLCRRLEKRKRTELMNERIEENFIAKEDAGHSSGDDDDTCEEWDRHQATCEDVSNQDRNKDRLFEEEMEVVWEKGGSGLVFYTDAQYWHQMEGDFDEQTADDFNVDMSAYYEDGAGDMDIRDYLTIRQEGRRRRGTENTDRFSAGIGKFELHTKGFGSKILRQQGWVAGCGVGSWQKGMPEALDAEGQHPRDRTGFGYRGEKMLRFTAHCAKPTKRRSDVLISTVYDNVEETDPTETLLRRNEGNILKHRNRMN